MISKKTIYAFKALIHLAGTPSGQPVLIADLARDENIPKKFLEFILLSLRKGGLLQSRVGKGGGYSLALPANRITVGSIVRILEGDIARYSVSAQQIMRVAKNARMRQPAESG